MRATRGPAERSWTHDNGKVYKCTMTVEQDGKKLKVRGFIGFSLLGRTEYWLRQE